MKSKKIRKVILRTPEMRCVRNNLRIVLKLAIKDELSRLARIKGLFHDKDIKSSLTPSQQQRYDYVGIKYRALSERYNHSILQCGSGSACYSLDKAIEEGLDPRDRPSDLDLVWVPWLERWYCVPCFNLKGLGEITSEEFDDPEMRKWVKEEFAV